MVNISLFEPFLPKVLMEGYEKGTLFKQQDSASQDSHTEQDNVNLAIEENNLEQGSLELLLSYLSCPNIRIKVRLLSLLPALLLLLCRDPAFTGLTSVAQLPWPASSINSIVAITKLAAC